MSSSTFSFERWFYLLVALCGILVAIFFAASEILVRTNVGKHDLFRTHVNFFYTAKSENVVLGDSHAAMGFTNVEGFINLAFPGENLEIIAQKVEAYFHNKKPGKIILQADPLMLSKYREDAETVDVVKQYVNSEDVRFKALAPWHLPHLLSYWTVFFKGIVLGQETFQSVREFRADGSQMTDDEVVKMYDDTQLQLNVKDLVERERPLEPAQAPKSVAFLQRMLEFFSKHGAKVCMVTFPALSDFVAYAEKEAAYQHALDFFKQRAAEFGYPYKDYWGYFSDRSLFSDAGHLNRKGAELFSKMLVNECFTN